MTDTQHNVTSGTETERGIQTDHRDTMTPAQAEERNGYLTTTGRVTGKPHEIEIWFATDADRARIYLLSGGGDRADWVRNLDLRPAVTFRADGVTYKGRAARITDPVAERDARLRVAAKYYGLRDGELPNDWSRTALPVVIHTLERTQN